MYSSDLPMADLPSPQQFLHYVNFATEEHKRRVEAILKDLTAEEREKFRLAKGNEIGARIDHGTVRRVVAGTLDDRQIMRRR